MLELCYPFEQIMNATKILLCRVKILVVLKHEELFQFSLLNNTIAIKIQEYLYGEAQMKISAFSFQLTEAVRGE